MWPMQQLPGGSKCHLQQVLCLWKIIRLLNIYLQCSKFIYSYFSRPRYYVWYVNFWLLERFGLRLIVTVYTITTRSNSASPATFTGNFAGFGVLPHDVSFSIGLRSSFCYVQKRCSWLATVQNLEIPVSALHQLLHSSKGRHTPRLRENTDYLK